MRSSAEADRTYQAAYYQANKDRIKERQRIQRAATYDPASARERSLIQKYGITQADFDAMAERQGNRCAVCEELTDGLHVDHNHTTGEVRGLLCGNCNRALGILREDPTRIFNLAAYVLSFTNVLSEVSTWSPM